MFVFVFVFLVAVVVDALLAGGCSWVWMCVDVFVNVWMCVRVFALRCALLRLSVSIGVPRDHCGVCRVPVAVTAFDGGVCSNQHAYCREVCVEQSPFRC